MSLCLPTGTCNNPYMIGIPYKNWCLGFSLHKMWLTKFGHVQQIQASGIGAQRNGLLQSRQSALVCGGIQDSTNCLKARLEKRKGVLPSITSTPSQTLSCDDPCKGSKTRYMLVSV